MEKIRINEVKITPNPVFAGQRFIISVDVSEIVQGILTADGCYIETSDGSAIERVI